MNVPLVHYFEFKAKVSDLDLSHEELAVFGALSFICNELNVFSRLLDMTRVPKQDSKPLTLSANIQHHTILRTLTSRVFEAYDFIGSVSKKLQSTDSSVIKIFANSLAEIDALSSSKGFSINRNIRNEVSFHYKFPTALKNAKTISHDSDASIYINRLDGNCYFALGESLMYYQRLNRFSQSDYRHADVEKFSEDWIGWTLEVVKLIKSLQAKTLDLVVDRTNAKMRKTHYFVDPKLVASKSEEVIPIVSLERLS